MWSFLAARYASTPGIAGYEVLSEPQSLNATKTHAFHVATCNAVWAHDPRAACFIGAGAYYDRCARTGPAFRALLTVLLTLHVTGGCSLRRPYLDLLACLLICCRYNLDERYILSGQGPVIYAANYLTPKPYTKGELLNISYPMTQKMRCGDLVMKKDQPACPGGDMDAEIVFNKDFLRKLAAPFTAFSEKYDVPLWVDQVSSVSLSLSLSSSLADLLLRMNGLHAAYFCACLRLCVCTTQWGVHAAVGGGNASASAYLTDALDIFEQGG